MSKGSCRARRDTGHVPSDSRASPKDTVRVMMSPGGALLAIGVISEQDINSRVWVRQFMCTEFTVHFKCLAC